MYGLALSVILLAFPQFSNIIRDISRYGSIIYFYYDIFLFVGFILFFSLGYKDLVKIYKRIPKRISLYVILLSLTSASLVYVFVKPTVLVFNDEYIYASIAKSMIYNHAAGICSFSVLDKCMPNSIGLFHQPSGWPLMEAVAFMVLGTGLNTAFDLNLFLYAIAIIAVFYTSFNLTEDYRVALITGLIFAAMPLLIRYAESSVPDISTTLFVILSVLFITAYMRTKRFSLGVLSVFSIAFTLSTKVDAIIILPVTLSVLLFYKYKFKGPKAKTDIKKFLVLVVLFLLISMLQLAFIYISNTDSFGTSPNQPKFSLIYLRENAYNNTLFWFGGLNYVKTSAPGYYFNVEFPITFTIFAVFGIILLILRSRRRELATTLAWFAIVVLFYTSYYAGGLTYAEGIDSRYFLSSFTPLAILSALGVLGAYEWILSFFGAKSNKQVGLRITVMAFLIFLVMSSAIYEISTITTLNPTKIVPFAAERADLAMILSFYKEIPSNCIVVTFKPPLWYILNRSNIYTGWTNLSTYSAEYTNLSDCAYFDYSPSCKIWNDNPAYANTGQQCTYFVKSNKLVPVVSTNFNYTWPINLTVSKIVR